MTDTVVFNHQYITTPRVTKADAIVAAVNKLTQVLRGETDTNIKITEKQKLTQLVDIFQTMASKISKKEAKKPSKPFTNSATQTRVANTQVEYRMQQQKSNNKSPTARELTKTMPAIKDMFVASTDENKQRPYIISQEDADQ